MPPIPPETIVAFRHDHLGRFAVFHQPGPSLLAPLPWQRVSLDQGKDNVDLAVRLDEHDASGATGWTARDLLRIALARQVAEAARSGNASARRSASHLAQALIALQHRSGLPPAPIIDVAAGPRPSIYPWTIATLPGVGSLMLCPVPHGAGEGVTPELLLHVLEQLFGDAIGGCRADRHLRAAARSVTAALREETARLRPTEDRKGPSASK